MGSQIACEYALGGHDVVVVTRSPESASARVKRAFDLVQRENLVDTETATEAGTRLRFANDLRIACDVAIEALPEQFGLKSDVLKEVAEHAPRAVLATNTSSLSVTALGKAADASARTVGTHYWNPPLLMPLVELVVGSAADETVSFMRDTLTRLGKKPIVVLRDTPGFIWNRLQAAVLREAVWLAENSVAAPEDIDGVVREGLARRWRYLGPFETVALGGVSTWQQVSSNLLPHLSQAQSAPHLERWVDVEKQHVDALRERRDAGLAAELRKDRHSSD